MVIYKINSSLTVDNQTDRQLVLYHRVRICLSVQIPNRISRIRAREARLAAPGRRLRQACGIYGLASIVPSTCGDASHLRIPREDSSQSGLDPIRPPPPAPPKTKTYHGTVYTGFWIAAGQKHSANQNIDHNPELMFRNKLAEV